MSGPRMSVQTRVSGDGGREVRQRDELTELFTKEKGLWKRCSEIKVSWEIMRFAERTKKDMGALFLCLCVCEWVYHK